MCCRSGSVECSQTKQSSYDPQHHPWNHQHIVVWGSCGLSGKLYFKRKEKCLIKTHTFDLYNYFWFVSIFYGPGQQRQNANLGNLFRHSNMPSSGSSTFLSELFSSLSKLLQILVCLLWIWHPWRPQWLQSKSSGENRES